MNPFAANPDLDRLAGGTLEWGKLLAPLTNLRVGGPARAFVRLREPGDIPALIAWCRRRSLPWFVLGGGSNIVVSDQGFNGLVMKMEIPGIRLISETDEAVEVETGAGADWDGFVGHAVEQGWWGVENMSLIPGTCGAVPVQNVGAYGQEARHVIQAVNAYDTHRNAYVEMTNAECHFAYRKSIFNSSQQGRYIIVAVRFRLAKQGRPVLSRHSLVEELERAKNTGRTKPRWLPQVRGGKRRRIGTAYTQPEIRQAIIRLRSNGASLPVPHTVGSAGSFFQTSVVAPRHMRMIIWRSLRRCGLGLASRLAACWAGLATPDGIKIPPRMLLKACGLATLASNNVSLYPRNCTVLITTGERASSTDILQLVRIVRTRVFDQTSVVVPVEPEFVGFSANELRDAFWLPGDDSGSV